ncbi:hypothetical protein L6452_08241 [Arctium lappa]|uniref:Uncharacterized protein n=1 Tax=Arctium lappa TaxID=4217 RepID=A0ACB9DH38_ARCLA|nr:hypothetical protein L6452_08241 [Arctium lappa]
MLAKIEAKMVQLSNEIQECRRTSKLLLKESSSLGLCIGSGTHVHCQIEHKAFGGKVAKRCGWSTIATAVTTSAVTMGDKRAYRGFVKEDFRDHRFHRKGKIEKGTNLPTVLAGSETSELKMRSALKPAINARPVPVVVVVVVGRMVATS